MRKSPILLGCALVATLAGTAVAAPARVANVVAEEQLILPADGPYKVVLENLKGRVIVRGWNKNVAYVKATKAATHALSEAESQLLASAEVKFARPEATAVRVTTHWRGHGETFPAVMLTKTAHLNVDYLVMVPPETAVEIRQEQGPVTVYGVDGRVDVFTRDGEVALTAVSGRAEATTERGDIRFAAIAGDAVASTQHGQLAFSDVTGDIRAATHTGDVRVDVDPRFAGEVSFHTVSGVFRSDLITYETDLEPGDRGYVGILRGPLAKRKPPEVRFRIDTVSGTATVANARSAAGR